jgi:predicted AlkP superfamily phosphohydrolase/phosphomutase
MTHPPQAVNGGLICDFLLATGQGEMSYPPGLLKEIEGKLGQYPSDVVLPYFAASKTDEDIRRFVQEYTRAMEYKFRAIHYFLERFDPDFLMVHLYGNDQISHWLWHLLDGTHPWSRKEESDKHFETIFEYYRVFDAEIGNLLGRTAEDSSLFVVSDHGFGPLYKDIDLNTWLYREGYLVLRERLLTRLRQFWWKAGYLSKSLTVPDWFIRGVGKLIRPILKDQVRGGVNRLKWVHTLAQSLFLSINDIDWSRTKAFSPFGFGQIRINVQGTWAQGWVSPGAEYDQIKHEITARLRTLTDPETGETVGAAIYSKEEVYWGEFFEDAPDIVFIPTDGKYRPKSTTVFYSNQVISPSRDMSGTHKMNGVLAAQGNPLKRGALIEGARITDIFPSILYLMGMPIPDDVDGEVLRQIFTEGFLQQHPIRSLSEAAEPVGQTLDLQEQGGEEVIERLKKLGYLE